MKIAVTGSRGFIGRLACARLAASGHEVVRIGRRADGAQGRLTGDAYQQTEADGGSESRVAESLTEIFAGADAVLHLAGRSVDSLATPLTAYLEPNVALTEQVALAAAEASVARVVFASSRMVYPSWLATPDVMLSEDCSEPPDSFYGMSKIVAEQVLALHARRSGFTAVALRIAQVTGPGDGGRGALSRMIEQARETGKVSVFGSGNAVRDIVDARDLMEAFERALSVTRAVGAPPLIANVGTGGFSVREMAAEVARQTGVDSGRIVHVPTQQEDRSAYRLDCAVAAHTLGWQPRYGLSEMVRDRLAPANGRAR